MLPRQSRGPYLIDSGAIRKPHKVTNCIITIQQIFLDFQQGKCNPEERTFLKRILDMLQRCYFARYEKLAKRLLRYRENPPLRLIKTFETALGELRAHLSQNGINMPLPKYPYDPDNINTHSHVKNPFGPGTIPNSHYTHKNIWKRVDGARGIR